MKAEVALTLRDALKSYPGLKMLVESIELTTPLGRRQLLDSKWLMTASDLNDEYDDTECLSGLLQNDETAAADAIRRYLMCVRDIYATVSALESGQVLGDIEFFEIKSLALIASELRELLKEKSISAVDMPDASAIVSNLDPEGERVAHFYVYDAYSSRLKILREELRKAQEAHTEDEADLYAACQDEENRVRQDLSRKLQPYSEVLYNILNAIGRLDLLMGRAGLCKSQSLCRPSIGNACISYKSLRNPYVAASLQQQGRDFQPVDVSILQGVTVITGANMAGKSVVLKTLALSQLMAQFGFHVPASEATIVAVSEVMTSIGDGQSEYEGMSSYAAEMLCIDKIIKEIRKGSRILALIDEPARTTNPEEGKALVNAIVELLGNHDSFSVVTTHYSGLTAPSHRLRVHGFREEFLGDRQLTASSINDFIDYRLEVCYDNEVPREALRIASLIGVDGSVSETAKRYLDLKSS